jgi:cell division protein ZipA
MSDTTLLRIAIAIAGLILIGAIVFFGRPRKQEQGKRVPRPSIADAVRAARGTDAQQCRRQWRGRGQLRRTRHAG